MKHSHKSHSSGAYYDMTVVFLTLLCVLNFGSLSLSLKAQTKTSDQRVTQTTVGGRNGKIAFTSSRDSNFEIYTMEANGSNQMRITNSQYDASPKWSPDGTKIAFLRSNGLEPYEIYVMNADGSNQTRLTNIGVNPEPPAWSPEGTRIVFVHENDGVSPFTREIFVVNADGTNQKQLTNSGRNDAPHWSPDGTRIVFYRFGSSVGIYVMNADGSNQKQLTNSGYDYDPRWSPDGSHITFTSFRDEPNPSTCNLWNCNEEIYSMNADGSNQTRLTNNPRIDTSPEWSPDSTRIVFRSVRDNNVNVYVMNADGTNQTRLTNFTDGNDVVSPIFSPDGTRIMFAYGYSFFDELISSQLYVMDAHGGNLVRLTNNATDVYEFGPDWQALPSVTCPNPIDCPEFFVRQHYLDFLNREPDEDGFFNWMVVMNKCAVGDLPCLHEQRLTTSGGFFGSVEFHLKGYFAFRFYRTAFDRLPEYSEISGDMQNVTGQTPEDVYARKATFSNGFVQRPEFVQLYNGLPNADYVAALMNRYGLTSITTPDPTAPNGDVKVTLTQVQLVSSLDTGALTRAQVLRAIVDSDQVFQSEFNRAFVAMQYYGYLRRTPEVGGYTMWLDYLNTHPGDFREMIRGFVDSTEYRSRFGQP